jgi:integrase/recombinase XerD
MSTLLNAVNDYLCLRRCLGFKLTSEGGLLSDFVSFMEREGSDHITNDLALRWATQPAGASAARKAYRLRIVRLFAQHWSATDPRTQVPPPGLLTYQYHRKRPYIFSQAEIQRLVEVAWTLQSARGLRPWTYSTAIGLVAVTGMRAGELINLDREDMDFDRGVLHIRLAKFGKSRLLPLHSSTRAVLHRYACQRDQIFPKPTTRSFFLSDQGRRLTWWILRWTFVKLSIQCGLRAPKTRHGPRLHDLRHTFAVQTVLDWYRSGANVEQCLPTLATYLGHVHVTDTYWYLSAIPELLALASARLEEGAPQP